jgi:hypothetical protein
LSEVRSELFQARRTVLGVVFDPTDVLISLTIISTAEDAATGVTRRKLLTEITVEVLIHFLISITVMIAVVVSLTTIASVGNITIAIVIAAAATTATRVDWGWTILVTWVF